MDKCKNRVVLRVEGAAHLCFLYFLEYFLARTHSYEIVYNVSNYVNLQDYSICFSNLVINLKMF